MRLLKGRIWARVAWRAVIPPIMWFQRGRRLSVLHATWYNLSGTCCCNVGALVWTWVRSGFHFSAKSCELYIPLTMNTHFILKCLKYLELIPRKRGVRREEYRFSKALGKAEEESTVAAEVQVFEWGKKTRKVGVHDTAHARPPAWLSLRASTRFGVKFVLPLMM